MRNITIPFKITKVDEEQRRVWGVATSEALDSQGDVLDYAASKKAVTDWMKTGNIREMHDEKKAVGKAFDAEFDDKNKKIVIGSYISRSADGENTWQKIKEGILTGYSVGGRVKDSILDKVKDSATGLEISAKRVTNWVMSELSLVDNPANPTAQILMVKNKDGNALDYVDLVKLKNALDERLAKNFAANSIPLQATWWMDKYQNEGERAEAIREYKVEQLAKMEKRNYSTKQRQDMTDKGEAMSDGSFPIKDKTDLANAIKAYGRAKNKAKAKAHIESRAKALGATDMLPENWDKKSEEIEMKKAAEQNAEQKKIKKDFGGTLRIASLACELGYFLSGEIREGDTETVAAIQKALVALKEAAQSELNEVGEDADGVMISTDVLEYAQKVLDIAKGSATKRELSKAEAPEAPAEAPVETPAAPAEAPVEKAGEVHSTTEGPAKKPQRKDKEDGFEGQPQAGAAAAVETDKEHSAATQSPMNNPTEPQEAVSVTHASEVEAAEVPGVGTGDDELEAPGQVVSGKKKKNADPEMKKSLSDMQEKLDSLLEKSGMVKAVTDLTDLVKKSLEGQQGFDERLKKFEDKPQPITVQAPYVEAQEVIKGRENNRVDGEPVETVLKNNGMDDDEITRLIKRSDHLITHPGEGDPRERGEVFRKMWKLDVEAHRKRLNLQKSN